MRAIRPNLRHRRWVRVVVAIAVPLVLGAAAYGLAVAPIRGAARVATAEWRSDAGRLAGVVARGREVVAAGQDAVAAHLSWIHHHVPRAAAPERFVEDLGALTRQLGIGHFEYRRGNPSQLANTGYRVDPIDVRVLASFDRLLGLWAWIDESDQPIVCRRMHLWRYGDEVAATFVIDLLSRPATLGSDELHGGGMG